MKKLLLVGAILIMTAAANAGVISSTVIKAWTGEVNDSIELTLTIEQRENESISIIADVTEGYGDIIAMYIDFNELPSDLDASMFVVEIFDNNQNQGWSVLENPVITIDENNVSGSRAYNMNGGIAPFDVGIITGDEGIGEGSTDVDPAKVTINLPSLAFDNIDRIGIRLQSASLEIDREGSCKVVIEPVENTPVPEPALLTLLGAGLLATALFGKRKKSK